jgi:hypothetical protein
MNLEIKNYGGQRFVTGIIRSAFLLLIFGAQIQAAMAQNGASGSEKLTLAGAVDLALKQNLDIQVANI